MIRWAFLAPKVKGPNTFMSSLWEFESQCYRHLSFIIILHLCLCYHISFMLSCSCLYEKYITRLLAYMASRPFFELDFWTWFRGRMPGQVQASPSASSAVPGPITVLGTPGRHTHLPKRQRPEEGEFPVTNGAPASPPLVGHTGKNKARQVHRYISPDRASTHQLLSFASANNLGPFPRFPRQRSRQLSSCNSPPRPICLPRQSWPVFVNSRQLPRRMSTWRSFFRTNRNSHALQFPHQWDGKGRLPSYQKAKHDEGSYKWTLRMNNHHSFNRVLALTTFTHRNPTSEATYRSGRNCVHLPHQRNKPQHLNHHLHCHWNWHPSSNGQQNGQQKIPETLNLKVRDGKAIFKSHLCISTNPEEGERRRMDSKSNHQMFNASSFCSISKQSEGRNHDDNHIPKSVKNDPNHEGAAIRTSDNATQHSPRQQIPDYFIQQHDPTTPIGHRQKKNILTVYLCFNHWVYLLVLRTSIIHYHTTSLLMLSYIIHAFMLMLIWEIHNSLAGLQSDWLINFVSFYVK